MNDKNENAERTADSVGQKKKISDMNKMEYLSSFFEMYNSNKKEFQNQKTLLPMKTFHVDFEKYLSEKEDLDWPSAFPKRFKTELKDQYYIRQIDFVDVLSNPKPNEDDLKKILIENNITPYLDGNEEPINTETKTDLESKQNTRKMGCYGIDKRLWYSFEQEGFNFDDLPDVPRRSLCIPFDPGMNGAWAPNGYGKSFVFGTVFQTLRRSFIEGSPIDSFEGFLREVTALTNQSSEQDVPSFSRNTAPAKPLIPFRQIAIGFDNHLNSDASFAVLIELEFDDTAAVESYSLSLDMSWSPVRTTDLEESVNIPEWIVHRESSTMGSSKFTGPTDVNRIRNFLDPNRWELVALKLFTQFHLTYVEIPKLAYNESMYGEIKEYIQDAVSGMIRSKPVEFNTWPYSGEIQGEIYEQLVEVLNASIFASIAFVEKEKRSEDNSEITNMIKWLFSTESLKEAVHLYLNTTKENETNYKSNLQAGTTRLLVDSQIEIPLMIDSKLKHLLHESIPRTHPSDLSMRHVNEPTTLSEQYEDLRDYLTNGIGNTLYLTEAFAEPEFEGEHSYAKGLSEKGIEKGQIHTSNYEYLKLMMEKNDDSSEWVGASLDEILPLVEGNIPRIIDRLEVAISKANIVNLEQSLNSVIYSDGPWGVRARLMNWGSDLGPAEPLILHQAGDENQRISWSQLSFGQKSELIIEGVLAKERQESMGGESLRCLVIDEPEAGRSEHWTNELILKLRARIENDSTTHKNSILFLSHRGLLLNEVFSERGYHVMHYIDMNDSEEE